MDFIFITCKGEVINKLATTVDISVDIYPPFVDNLFIPFVDLR